MTKNQEYYQNSAETDDIFRVEFFFQVSLFYHIYNESVTILKYKQHYTLTI